MNARGDQSDKYTNLRSVNAWSWEMRRHMHVLTATLPPGDSSPRFPITQSLLHKDAFGGADDIMNEAEDVRVCFQRDMRRGRGCCGM